MNDDFILTTIRRLTEPSCTLMDVVVVCGSLQARGELEVAATLYLLWARIHPKDPLTHIAYFNQGTVLQTLGRQDEALAAFRQAIELNPDFTPAHINAGSVLERQGDLPAAVAQWTLASERLAPVTADALAFKATALKQIGRVLESCSQLAAAEDALRRCLALNPRQTDVAQHVLSLRMAQCSWPVVQPWEGVRACDLLGGMDPLTLAAYADDPVFQLGSAWAYCAAMGDPSPDSEPVWRYGTATSGGGRLRVGYLSSDLRVHAIGFLMAELFECHHRDEIEVFVYYCGIPVTDEIQARYRAVVEHWVDIRDVDDLAAARMIAADGIQILVDVNGYTRDARTKLLSLRPAPIIVNWLGYPGSMGSPFHNYLIADEWVIPPEHEMFYSERVVRLPCYQPNDRRRVVAAAAPTRAEVGLPETGVVFCSFNGSHKISPATFDRWMCILDGVPGSVLWLLAPPDATRQHLCDTAARRGIEPDRLIFAPKLPNAEHLARYPLADLFLDNFPYGAHTTASDALWMGVPVVTMSGLGFASRVCGSLVRSAGLPEMVCDNAEDFVDVAITLGRDPVRLGQLRKFLISQRASLDLFDTDLLTRSLEGLYREMWEDFRAGRLPVPDLANLDIYRDVAIAHHRPDEHDIHTLPVYLARYRDLLAGRHKFRPIREDNRLWTADILKVNTVADDSGV